MTLNETSWCAPQTNVILQLYIIPVVEVVSDFRPGHQYQLTYKCDCCGLFSTASSCCEPVNACDYRSLSCSSPETPSPSPPPPPAAISPPPPVVVASPPPPKATPPSPKPPSPPPPTPPPPTQIVGPSEEFFPPPPPPVVPVPVPTKPVAPAPSVVSTSPKHKFCPERQSHKSQCPCQRLSVKAGVEHNLAYMPVSYLVSINILSSCLCVDPLWLCLMR